MLDRSLWSHAVQTIQEQPEFKAAWIPDEHCVIRSPSELLVELVALNI